MTPSPAGTAVPGRDGWRPAAGRGKALAMADPRRNRGPVAGGGILALTILGGSAIGVALRQPSLGLIGGIVVGAVISLLIWRRDRRS